MTMGQKLFIGAFFLILLGSAEAWAGSGWTSYGQVTELTPTTSGQFLAKINVSKNPSDCQNRQWFYRNYSGTGADHIFQTLLGAITFGKNIRVEVSGGCDLNGYSEISSVSIVQ